jgi:predicted nucleic acid-binding protein
MTLVVDASVALKWFVLEAGSEAALRLVGRGERLVAPNLLVAEVCNATWKRVRRGDAKPEQLADAAETLPRAIDAFVPDAPLARRAAAIALELGHPVYDCFYLALAEREDARVVTADRRLVERLARTAWKARIEAL